MTLIRSTRKLRGSEAPSVDLRDLRRDPETDGTVALRKVSVEALGVETNPKDTHEHQLDR